MSEVAAGLPIKPTKECSKCGRDLPLEENHKDKRGASGRKARCKKCFSHDKVSIATGVSRKEQTARQPWEIWDQQCFLLPFCYSHLNIQSMQM